MEAERLLKTALDAWRKAHPRLAEWAKLAIPEGLTMFDVPAAHRIRLRTTTGLKRIKRKLRRRTRGTCISPNPDACLHPVSALARRTRRRMDDQQGLSHPQHVTQAS